MKIRELEKKYVESLKVKDNDKDDIALELGLMVAEARIRLGLTQQELARKIGTKQPSIARVENGSSLVSNSLLIKISKAMGVKFILPRFDFASKFSIGAQTTENVFTKVPASLSADLNFVVSAINQSTNSY